MYANALLGVWPYIFQDNPGLKKLYNFYSYFTFTYFFLFIVTAYVELFQLISMEDTNVQAIFANLAITLLYTVTLWRVYALKTERFAGIISEIIETEHKVRSSEDEQLINIYESHTRQSKISNMIFMVNIFIGELILLVIV